MMIRRRFAAALGVAALAIAMASSWFVTSPALAAGGELVLVAGATGRTGKEVVTQLVARNYRVRALVRDVAKAQGTFPAGVELVVGDVRESGSLNRSMKGVKYVISTIGAGGGPRGEAGNGPEEIDFQGVANLAAAAKKARVKHFVLVSSASVTKAAENPMAFMRPILAAKFKGENALRASGVSYTVIRPGGLIDEAGGAKIVQFSQGDQTTGRIPRADVALVCVEALGRRGAQRKTFEILSGTGSPPQDFGRDFAALAVDPAL
jgi:uncharacterized protein YbjT (DUF2867 family)